MVCSMIHRLHLVIGVSLSKPHTSEKDVCDRPSMEIYDQITETPNKARTVNIDMSNNRCDLLRLKIRLVQPTVMQTIIGVIY